MKNFGLIGYPLKNTLSGDIFKFLFKKRKIRGRYKVLRIPPEALPRVFKKLGCFDGLNITTPYKTKFSCFCHSFKGPAGLIKAVNTLKNQNGKFIGYNTDIFGFKKAIQSKGFNPTNKKCCIFGSGGAARAVLFVLFSSGARSITVVSRNVKKAALNLNFLKSVFRPSKLFFSTKAPSDCHMYVNATLLSNSYFPLDRFSPEAVFLDLNYSFSKTPFLKIAQESGAAHIIDGKEMLFYQALASFIIWTGKKIAFKEMEKLKKEFFKEL
jgi:shikimate dehydrogenase